MGIKPIIFIVCLFIPGFVSADDLEKHQPFFNKFCVQCHGAAKQKGDVRLDRLGEVDSDTWQNVYDQLASESMPPSDQPQPTEAERRAFEKHVLELAEAGSVVTASGMRRLNKREFRNTVRDLLGLRKGAFDPAEYVYDDEIDEGFDTASESLVISNELLLEYMDATEKSLRQALFSSEQSRPPVRVVDVNLKKMSGTSRRYINTGADFAITRSGGKAKLYDGRASSRPMKTPGRYRITVTASGVDRDAYPIRFHPEKGPLVLGFGLQQETRASVTSKGVLLKTFELKDNVEQTFTFDSWIDKSYFPYFSFVNGPAKPITQVRSNIRRRKLPSSAMKQPFKGPGIKITQFKIEGPLHEQWPPESFRKTFDSNEIPDLASKKEREELILRFATRAFRRSVTKEEVALYVAFLDRQYEGNRDWLESTIKTLAAMMTSVDFLYIREGQGELNSYELANRLSYFLWSTMPDDELFALAKSGKLKDAAVFNQQVSRLLDDPRSNQFSHSFSDQWLSLSKLGTMPPDAKGEFREYYRKRLEPAMLEETHRFFSYVLYKNRSVGDFIDSNYSFINKNLAELYGVPFGGKEPNKFQRVTFPASAKRGGLMGHGSILTLSANGVETSPIERGVWVLDNLLGIPTPPPPKEVPALTPDLNGAVTIREMLELHRNDAACMECHRRMDPLGFALEAFDPIGRYRTKYSKKQKVSTHGNYLGKDFADVTELKQILSRDIRPFARNLIVRIAEYAKGRKLIAADYSTVQRLVDQAAENDFKFKDIVLAIANSDLMTDR